MKTRKEIAAEIRKQLKKEHGYTSRQVSVRSRSAGYSDAINISIKDLAIPVQQVEEIAERWQEIRRDERTHEILEGANTYVSVDYDSRTIHAAQEARLEEARAIMDEHEGITHGEIIKKHGDYEMVYFPNLSYGLPEINFQRVTEKEQDGTEFIDIETIEKRIATNEHNIAQALVIFDAQYKKADQAV